MTIESFAKINLSFREAISSASEEERVKIAEYLNDFYDDSNEKSRKCIITETTPYLRWTLTHGVAEDINTGIDWRQYHYFVINGSKRLYQTTLQYHPDTYYVEEESEEDHENL
jgi:hypothetical protein